MSLGISHVSEQRVACGTSKKNQYLKSHLSYFALKPTLQRRAMENKVFFLNCVCAFFVITNVGINGIFGRTEELVSDIVSQVVLPRVGF